MSERFSAKYDEARKQEKEIEKHLALVEIKRWIETVPEEKRDEPAIVAATRSFTPNEVVKEIELWTEYGERFAEMMHDLRIELVKKEGMTL